MKRDEEKEAEQQGWLNDQSEMVAQRRDFKWK